MMQVVYYWPDGYGGEVQMEADTDTALADAVGVTAGDAAAQEVADALGCSRAEAYRRCAALVADMLAGRLGQ